MLMEKSDSPFGLKVAWKSYGWGSFVKDSILPVIISFGLSFLIYQSDADIYVQLKHLVGVGIEIVPTMIALILTAYALILTFFTGRGFLLVSDTAKGKELIKILNSSFAICLIISIITIIVVIIASCIISIDIEIPNSNLVNYFAFFAICYLLVFSVSILFGIVIDIFNSGQTTLFDGK